MDLAARSEWEDFRISNFASAEPTPPQGAVPSSRNTLPFPHTLYTSDFSLFSDLRESGFFFRESPIFFGPNSASCGIPQAFCAFPL